MEQKNRMALVAAIAVLIMVAMFTSFGRSLFTQNIPEVVLPTPDASQTDSNSSPEHQQEQLQRIEVTPSTVQSVISTLSRSGSYYRELTVETFWDETGTFLSTVQVWVDGDWSHIRQTMSSGLVRHDLVGDGTVYYWYEGDTSWCTAPADALSADLAQHIPTYETVLALPTDSITSAGYENRGDLPCIFVEVKGQTEGYAERYWVSVDSGLLVSAETCENDVLIHRMNALTPIQSISPSDAAVFSLPDGSALHQIAS